MILKEAKIERPERIRMMRRYELGAGLEKDLVYFIYFKGNEG